MKKSELKKIIKEEIKHILKERAVNSKESIKALFTILKRFNYRVMYKGKPYDSILSESGKYLKLFKPGKLEHILDVKKDIKFYETKGNSFVSITENLEEKAVSKRQQSFMGMVRAAQTGEKPASKKVADVAKTMKKKDVKDFASTKHTGLPEKAPKNEADAISFDQIKKGNKITFIIPGTTNKLGKAKVIDKESNRTEDFIVVLYKGKKLNIPMSHIGDIINENMITKLELKKIIKEELQNLKSQKKEYLKVLKYVRGNNSKTKKAEMIKKFQNQIMGVDYGNFKNDDELINWWLSSEQQKLINERVIAGK